MTNPVAPMQYANLEKAQVEGRVLWAMDMRSGYPVSAHRITAIEYAADGRPITYATACHRRMEPALHGCWETHEGNLPLQAHAIHCDENWTVTGPSGLPGPSGDDTPERGDLTG